jgi:Transglutaminase-like superfamily
MTRVRRRRLRDFALATEALILLCVCRFLVLAAPLRRIVGWLGAANGAPPAADQLLISDLDWALTAASSRLPTRIACYELGIAACWMLRRRGYAANFHYGVGKVDDHLAAHVWVTSGGHAVTGCENADQFSEMPLSS